MEADRLGLSAGDHAFLESQYQELKPIWQKLVDEAVFTLIDSLNSAGLKTHSVTHRIKAFDSFAEKATRKQMANPFDEMQDLVGIRAVCLFLSDIPKVAKLLHDCFDVLEEDDKIDGGDASTFGYMSFHFIAKLKDTYSGPRYKGIVQMPFEIQVRTIAMDAWSAASHYLDYKSEADVPSELRRDFYALSGLFYVADKHFEMFFKAREAGIAEISETLENPSPVDSWPELNLDSLTAYLRSRFPDRKQFRGADNAELLVELRQAGIFTLDELKKMVDENFEWFLKHEKTHPPSEPEDGPDESPKPGRKFAAIGVIRVIRTHLDSSKEP